MKKGKIAALAVAAVLTVTGGSLAFASNNDGALAEKIQSIFSELKSGEVTNFEDGSKAVKQEITSENGIKAESGIYVAPGAEISDEEMLESFNQENQQLGELEFEGSIEVPADGSTVYGVFPAQ